MPTGDDDVARVAGWVAEAGAVTVLTGAGVSTESGIPDFRGPDGVWTRSPEAQRLSSLQEYRRDPDVRRRAWRDRRDSAAWHAVPGPAHRAVVDLARGGRLRALLTQNVDGLHQLAGSDPATMLELHGTLRRVRCLDCGAVTDMQAELARVDAGEADPACRSCGGMLKSDTIAFGQELDPDVLRSAADAARECDLFLAAGTSLTVHPAAGLCRLAAQAGARLVVVNAGPTPYDEAADAVLRGPVGAVLPALVPDASRVTPDAAG